MGSVLSGIGTGAAAGALAGTILPGLGNLAGAIIGGATGLVYGVFQEIKGTMKSKVGAMFDNYADQMGLGERSLANTRLLKRMRPFAQLPDEEYQKLLSGFYKEESAGLGNQDYQNSLDNARSTQARLWA